MNEESICHKCIPDEYLAKEIKIKGIKSMCSICQSESRNCIELTALSDKVLKILDETIILAEEMPFFDSEGEFSHLDRRGTSLETFIAEIFNCDEDNEIVHAILSEISSISALEIMDGGEPRYDADLPYNTKPADLLIGEIRWDRFRQSILHERRFFNKEAEGFLDWLFEDLDHLEGIGTAPIRAISENNIYRGRQCEDLSKALKILEAPEKNLGAPPKELANNGRMNPKGIPAFYGAFDRTTCIAELRPPVGSTVVSGCFSLKRPITILDFTALETAFNRKIGSPFSEKHQEQRKKLAFIRNLHKKISAPIQPNQDQDYLTTQFIAEYLSSKKAPPIDGFIFSSAQSPTCNNIVIFSHAAVTETSLINYDLPAAIVYVENSAQIHTITAATYKFQTVTEQDLTMAHNDWDSAYSDL